MGAGPALAADRRHRPWRRRTRPPAPPSSVAGCEPTHPAPTWCGARDSTPGSPGSTFQCSARKSRVTVGIVESEPGLYFIGLKFLYSVSSEQIHGVGRDADYIAGRI